MFTVLVKEARQESEVVFEASQVRKFLYDTSSRGSDNPGLVGEVVCDVPDGQITYHIRATADPSGKDEQTIFVMNRDGATVAKYHC